MSEKLKKCGACEDSFNWLDEVVIVDDEPYHKNCLTLYPTGYCAFLNGEYIGETENEDGSEAYEIMDAGEYLEGTE